MQVMEAWSPHHWKKGSYSPEGRTMAGAGKQGRTRSTPRDITFQIHSQQKVDPSGVPSGDPDRGKALRATGAGKQPNWVTSGQCRLGGQATRFGGTRVCVCPVGGRARCPSHLHVTAGGDPAPAPCIPPDALPVAQGRARRRRGVMLGREGQAAAPSARSLLRFHWKMVSFYHFAPG